MIPWLVCLLALVIGAGWDWHTRTIPVWLPAIPLVTIAASSPWPDATGPFRPVLIALVLMAGAVTVLGLAAVGWGDIALMLPIALVLEWWVVIVLAVSLALGLWTLGRRGMPDDPFVPHLLVGFVAASGLRWWMGG